MIAVLVKQRPWHGNHSEAVFFEDFLQNRLLKIIGTADAEMCFRNDLKTKLLEYYITNKIFFNVKSVILHFYRPLGCQCCLFQKISLSVIGKYVAYRVHTQRWSRLTDKQISVFESGAMGTRVAHFFSMFCQSMSDFQISNSFEKLRSFFLNHCLRVAHLF